MPPCRDAGTPRYDAASMLAYLHASMLAYLRLEMPRRGRSHGCCCTNR